MRIVPAERELAIDPRRRHGLAALGGGLVVVGLVLAAVRVDGSAAWLLVAAAAHACSSFFPVRLLRDGQTHALTLDEAVLVVLLATGAGDVAPLAALVGLFVGNVIKEVDPVKVAVNVGTLTIAADVGVRVHELVAPSQRGLDPVNLGAAALGGLAAWAVGFLVVSRVIAVATGRSCSMVLRRDGSHAARGLVGNLVVGLPLGGLAAAAGWSVALAAPLVALAVRSQGQIARSAEMRTSSERLQALSKELLDVPLDLAQGADDGADQLLGRTLRATGTAFMADTVSLSVPGGRSWRWTSERDAVVPWDPPDEPPRASRGRLVAAVRLDAANDGLLLAEDRRGVEPWDRTDAWRLAMVADDLAASLRTRWLLRDLLAERDALAVTTGALERVVAAVGDGVVTLDAEGVVRSWNAAIARLTGYPPHRVIGRPFQEVLELEDADDDLGGADGAAAGVHGRGAAMHEMTVRWVPAHGERLLAVRRREALDDETTVLVVRDVTAQRHQEALQRDFVTTVSHELRTPLTTLQGAIDLLLEDPPEERREALHGMVDRQLARLDRLAQQFAGFADLVLGGVEPVARPFDLLARLDALGLGDQLHGDSRTLPEVVGVAEAVDNAVQALVDNANEHGGGLDRIEVHVHSRHVELHVVDRGPGIAPADRERVFRPFVRLGRPGTRGQGTGLGLAMARGGLRTGGGGIELGAGADGDGTVVRLVLPRAEHARVEQGGVEQGGVEQGGVEQGGGAAPLPRAA